MSKSQQIRAFDYVNRPYIEVREALHDEPLAMLRAATSAAASRAHAVASGLKVNLSGIAIGTEIEITVHRVEHVDRGPLGKPATRIELEWEAATAPGLFPMMDAELFAYALTPTETQLDFEGHYRPPLGIVGGAIDAVIGRRIAEASVRRFVTDVATHLRGVLDTD